MNLPRKVFEKAFEMWLEALRNAAAQEGVKITTVKPDVPDCPNSLNPESGPLSKSIRHWPIGPFSDWCDTESEAVQHVPYPMRTRRKALCLEHCNAFGKWYYRYCYIGS